MALNAEDSQFLETRKFQLEKSVVCSGCRCTWCRTPIAPLQQYRRAGAGIYQLFTGAVSTRIEQRINTGLVRKSKQGVYTPNLTPGRYCAGI